MFSQPEWAKPKISSHLVRKLIQLRNKNHQRVFYPATLLRKSPSIDFSSRN